MQRMLGATEMTVALGLAWLAAGAGVAWALSLRGHPRATAISAVAAWPLLLPLLRAPPSRPVGEGPMASRIAACFEALFQALAESGGASHPGTRAEMTALMDSLQRADSRLAMVDRLLDDRGLPDLDDPALRRSMASLQDARGHAAGEIEAVLSGVLQLRVQLGLQALAGDRQPVRERLREMTARIHALEEVSPFTPFTERWTP